MKICVKDLIEDIEAKAKEKRLSLSKICERAGIARSTYQRWKQGISDPSITSINRIYDVLEGRR